MIIEDEKMETDLRGRVVALEQRATTLERLSQSHEEWRRQMDIFNARRDEQFKHLTDSFSTLNKKIDDLNGTLKWAVKTFIGGLILAAAAFLIKGGFHIP